MFKIKWWHIVLLIPCLFLLFVIIFLIPYFMMYVNITEDNRISMSLPFDSSKYQLAGISPAGELLYHEGGLGHCGFDFGFNSHNVPIISVSNGTINKIWADKNKEWEIEIFSGDYVIRYGILSDYNRSLKKGMKVYAGSFLGYPQNKKDGTNSAFHFEMSSKLSAYYPWLERLCPYTYFNNESRAVLDATWAGPAWQYKELYPYICSGGYMGRDSIKQAFELDKTGYASTFDFHKDREIAKQIDERLANSVVKKTDDIIKK